MAYTELVGRVTERRVDVYIYHTIGVTALEVDATAPKEGDATGLTLAATDIGYTLSLSPICTAVRVDEKRYPGRYLHIATWELPKLRTEI